LMSRNGLRQRGGAKQRRPVDAPSTPSLQVAHDVGASQEADEKWVIAQEGNEPAAETLPFMRAADSAKQELEKATKRAAEQKKTDESARIPSYAGIYRWA
jgi:hypothetical protein